MNCMQKALDALLKDGRKADAVECALVAALVLLAAVALEATLIYRIRHEFAMITNRI